MISPDDRLTVYQIEKNTGWERTRYIIAYMGDYNGVKDLLEEDEQIATTMPLDDVVGGRTLFAIFPEAGNALLFV